jgi:O-antigen/teichoic acid export membrane protein
VYVNGGVLLLGWFASAESAADFLVAQKVMLTLVLLLVVIKKSAFPTASRLLAGDPAPALRLAARLMRYYLAIIIPVFLLVAFHAKFVLTLLYGEAYGPAAGVLVILLAALPFIVVGNMLQFLLMAMPRPSAVLVSRAAGAAVLLALCAVWIPRYGAEGAALALVAGELAGMALMFGFVRRATGGLPWDIHCFAPVAAGAFAAGVYIAASAWPLFFGLPLAATTYIVVALTLGAIRPGELKDLGSLLSSFIPIRPGASRSAEARRDDPDV